MKHRITSSLKTLTASRPLTIVLGLFGFGCIGLLIYYALNIHPSELQIVNHYTSFGTTNFYRDRWYYLIGFVAFVCVMALAHTALTYRILVQKGHELAIAFAWLGVVMVVVTAAVSYQVLSIASLT